MSDDVGTLDKNCPSYKTKVLLVVTLQWKHYE